MDRRSFIGAALAALPFVKLASRKTPPARGLPANFVHSMDDDAYYDALAAAHRLPPPGPITLAAYMTPPTVVRL